MGHIYIIDVYITYTTEAMSLLFELITSFFEDST
jgi:hypothetical protein